MLMANLALATFGAVASEPMPVLENYTLADSGGVAVTSLAINKPASPVNGNLFLGFGSTKATTTTFSPVPTGFTEIADGQGIEAVKRTVDGSEAATFTFTQSASDREVAAMLQFSAWTTVTAGTPGGSDTASGITMPKSGILIACFALDNAGVVSSVAGMTLVASTASGNTKLYIYKQIVGGGATGDRVATVTGGTSRGVLMGVTK